MVPSAASCAPRARVTSSSPTKRSSKPSSAFGRRSVAERRSAPSLFLFPARNEYSFREASKEKFMHMSLTVLITGATAGIGRHAALHLAAKGHHVIASGRKADLLADLAAEAACAGHRLDTVRLDVTDARSIEAAVAQIDRLTSGAGLDGLINNAGYG